MTADRKSTVTFLAYFQPPAEARANAMQGTTQTISNSVE